MKTTSRPYTTRIFDVLGMLMMKGFGFLLMLSAASLDLSLPVVHLKICVAILSCVGLSGALFSKDFDIATTEMGGCSSPSKQISK